MGEEALIEKILVALDGSKAADKALDFALVRNNQGVERKERRVRKIVEESKRDRIRLEIFY